MLSKTAENLYWTSRYIERADSIARLLEVAYRINLIPNSSRVHNEWTSILETSGIKDEYVNHYGNNYKKEKRGHNIIMFPFHHHLRRRPHQNLHLPKHLRSLHTPGHSLSMSQT